jgi:GntR family transcriptional regulator
LSRELKINPNTAHKAVTQLVHDGLLEVLPGQGTVVARRGESSPAERASLLDSDIERVWLLWNDGAEARV